MNHWFKINKKEAVAEQPLFYCSNLTINNLVVTWQIPLKEITGKSLSRENAKPAGQNRLKN